MARQTCLHRGVFWWSATPFEDSGRATLLPMDNEELQVTGHAEVTSIDASPAIADGEGSVVTVRFITRQVDTIARVEILGADGSLEVLLH